MQATVAAVGFTVLSIVGAWKSGARVGKYLALKRRREQKYRVVATRTTCSGEVFYKIAPC